MPLPVLNRNPSCDACPLHQFARTVCVPSVVLLAPENPTGVLVVVGQNPGHQEDATGEPFVGPSGAVLRNRYLPALLRAHPGLLVILTNAVRCGPSPDIPAKPRKVCPALYLRPELDAIAATYPSLPRAVLAVGAIAVEGVARVADLPPLLRQFKTAVRTQPIPLPGGWTLFATYHPAFYLRDNTCADSIANHLDLLHHWLSGDIPPPLSAELSLRPFRPPLDSDPRIISLDIETFGAIATAPPQTSFVAPRAAACDGSPRDSLIATIAITPATREPSLAAVRESMVGWWASPGVQKAVRGWIARSTEIVGMNLAFDLSWLAFVDPLCHHLLSDPQRRLTDVSVLSYLDDERRPEKGLKDIGRALGVYNHTSPFASGYRFPSATDPDLLAYNAADTLAAIRAAAALESRLESRTAWEP
jgi:DNA polymerase